MANTQYFPKELWVLTRQIFAFAFLFFSPRNLAGQPKYFFGKILGVGHSNLKSPNTPRYTPRKQTKKMVQIRRNFGSYTVGNRKKIKNYNRGQIYCTPLLSTCPPHEEVFGLSRPFFPAVSSLKPGNPFFPDSRGDFVS